MLVLSVFSGIDLLGKGFEANGFCVVSAGDIILGKDIRQFRGVSGKFCGVIGGSPCQDFSKARRVPPTGYGLKMLGEFKRVVEECTPDWFLLENVPSVPDIQIDGYFVQRFSLCPSELGYKVRRKRHFQFGSKEGYILHFNRLEPADNLAPTVTCKSGKRTFADCCDLQGVGILHLHDLTIQAQKKVIGNAVHLGVSTEIAKQIGTIPFCPTFRTMKVCACGCGMPVEKKQSTYNATCRKRISLRKKSA